MTKVKTIRELRRELRGPARPKCPACEKRVDRVSPDGLCWPCEQWRAEAYRSAQFHADMGDERP